MGPLRHDPVTGADIEAFNVGYNRWIGENSRIGVDYQTKNDVTYNDDELNTKFSLIWNLLYWLTTSALPRDGSV